MRTRYAPVLAFSLALPLLAEAQYELDDEFNNLNDLCSEQVDILPVGSSNAAAFHVYNDVDVLQLITVESGVLSVTVPAIPDVAFFVEVLPDGCGGAIAFRQGGPGADATVEALVCGGRYYIRVSLQSGTPPLPMSYTLLTDLNAEEGCECNNSFGEACAMPLNINFTTRLWGTNNSLGSAPFPIAEDQDFYRLTATECGVLNVNITDIDPAQTIYVTCFNADFMPLATGRRFACNLGDVDLAVLLDTGVYYLRVFEEVLEAGGDQGEICGAVYNLSAQPFTLSWNFDTSEGCECNNTFATACTMPLAITFPSVLWGTNARIAQSDLFPIAQDQDYYRLVTTECGVLNVHITDIDPAQTLYVTCFNSALQPVGTARRAECFFGDVDLSVLLEAGEYYLRIYDEVLEAGGENGIICGAEYNLSTQAFNTTWSYDTSDTCECNNTPLTACPVPVNTPLTARISGINATFDPVEDVDHYSFAISCDTLSILVDSVPADQQLSLSLYAEDGITPIGLPSIASGPGASVTLERIGLPAATYLLRVSEAEGIMSGEDYQLYIACELSTGMAPLAAHPVALLVPNPTGGAFALITAPGLAVDNIRVSDALGQVLEDRSEPGSTRYHLDLSAAPAGLYSVVVSYRNGTRWVGSLLKDQ